MQLTLPNAELRPEEPRRRMTGEGVRPATAPAAHESIGPDGHDLADPRSQSGAGGNTPPRSAVGASTSHAAGSAALIAGLMDTLQRMSAPKRARKLPDGSWVTEHVEPYTAAME